MMADDERSPKAMLYPRDTSLDPQLVWKGKDEQDSKPLEVPVVPIYIQEKIHPQALIENLRDTAKEGEPEPELSLFADFNGIKDFRQKIDFYSHDLGRQPKWSNRLILGDSLLVMTSLAEKEGLKGKVQMIYMDPPYGIRFGSNWQVSTRKRDVRDGKAEDTTRQPEQVKAFRDTWELGIHSYLAYLRDRLIFARDLLTDSGSLFLQIGDENLHLVRCLLDEVFHAIAEQTPDPAAAPGLVLRVLFAAQKGLHHLGGMLGGMIKIHHLDGAIKVQTAHVLQSGSPINEQDHFLRQTHPPPDGLLPQQGPKPSSGPRLET